MMTTKMMKTLQWLMIAFDEADETVSTVDRHTTSTPHAVLDVGVSSSSSSSLTMMSLMMLSSSLLLLMVVVRL